MEMDVKKLREAKGLTQQGLANLLGVHINTVQNWESGKNIPATKYQILCKLLDDGAYTVDTYENLPTMSAHYVPVLPIAATAGKLSDYSVGVGPRDCEYSISPIAGADMIIPVLGESMAPEYGNGSRVVVKKINDKAFIEWGKVYVLDTENGAVLKEIHKGASDDELVCVSLNPDPKYAEFTVKRTDVRGMYRVLMCMSLK